MANFGFYFQRKKQIPQTHLILVLNERFPNKRTLTNKLFKIYAVVRDERSLHLHSINGNIIVKVKLTDGRIKQLLE